MPTVWISVLTCFGCFEGSRATGSVFQLFRKPGAVGGSHAKDALHAHATWGGVVECKIELTFVKLGSAYYSICGSRYRCRTKNGTNVRKIRRRVLRYVAVDDKYIYRYLPFFVRKIFV